MRGDRVEIVVDAGDGSRTFTVTATKAGRRVEVSTSRQVVEVVEVTRTGVPVRTARFLASRVIALVEHPAGDAPRVDPDLPGSGVPGSGVPGSGLPGAGSPGRPPPDW